MDTSERDPVLAPLPAPELLELVVRIHESGEPSAALRMLAGAMVADLRVEGAAWVKPEGHEPHGFWPAEPVAGDLLDAVRRLDSPRMLALEPEGRRCGADVREALLLPLGEPDLGALVVFLHRGPVGKGVDCWRRLGGAFAAVVKRERQLRRLEEEQREAQQRAEESEALHVVGLAANRTLVPEEVCQLAARFTRALLGAHYVTLSTLLDGRSQITACVGLRAAEPPAEQDPIAVQVIASAKPLLLSTADVAGCAGELSFHTDEGMRAGLGVPLALFGETFGALVVGYRREYSPSARDVRLALALARHAAVAISNARLHSALAERSGELERLNEELQWTTQAKERFFASMSHELRTPLNAILGYQSLLLDGVAGDLDDNARPFLEKAQRASRTLLHLVNDVLDLSKLEAGKTELVCRQVEIAEIVNDTLATMEPVAAAKAIRLTVSPLAPRAPLWTDAVRLQQILLNLLSNAVKFSRQGEVALAVWETGAAEPAAAHEPGTARPDHGWIEFRVTDSGPGIAEEDQERIFLEFEQIQGAASQDGTGLGLAISRKLARLLGGDLTVESTLSVGSTFVLRLPDRVQDVGGIRLAT
jgi:signal transduction histidine kinase